MAINDHLLLIGGKSASGKSASLNGIKNPEGVIYLNCEAGKKLPFKSKFKELIITTPETVYHAFAEAEKMPEVHTIVIDSLTFLMDIFESTRVIGSANTMKAWGDYAQYFKQMMSNLVANSTKNIFFFAHTSDVLNEAEMVNETFVKVKGSIMNTGVESYFSTVLACKKLPISKLVHKCNYLNITPEEEALGFKYVYQTKLTKETVNERMRSPLGMWSIEETYIDNNIQHVIDRLHEYYD